MPLLEISTGSAYRIVAWGEERKCQIMELILSLKASGNRDAERLMVLFDRTAKEGVPRNKEKWNSLGDGLFEFKANQVRVLCFFDRNRLIVLTHAFLKKTQKTPVTELKRARSIRSQYLQERGNI
jgi:phage-related protein